ncbi:MAG: hypothetical protein CME62_09440 [Halobacteriovoraceae bacterium]|nr:hypothetical protein [Halobacteriovoraceae bacterium]|tara:strand:+ start:12881 stop:14518 length:1638 start_codon:yes stop_codon:yes gene_type:complete
MKYLLVLIILFSCASGIQYNYVDKLKWEQYATCNGFLGNGFYPKNKDLLSVCTIKVNERTPKLYPEWKAGKTYQGLITRSRKTHLEPIYEVVAGEHTKNKQILFKKHNEKMFKLLNLTTGKVTNTPIESLMPGRKYHMPSINGNFKEFQKYSGAYSNDFTTFYVMDENKNILKKIENVDNDEKRAKLLPAVHSFHHTETIHMDFSTRMIRHKVGNRIFYQVYDFQGNKIGKEIPFEKVSHLAIPAAYRNAKLTNPTFNMTPWIHKGDNFYMPIVHGGKNMVYEGNSNIKEFIGIALEPETYLNYSKFYSGSIELDKVERLQPREVVLLDKEGVYYSKRVYDFQGHPADPTTTVNNLLKDPKNFYRTKVELPYYSNRFRNGKLVKEETIIFIGLDGRAQIDSVSWKNQDFKKVREVNDFKSFEEAEKFVMNEQDKNIKIEQARIKKAAEAKAAQEAREAIKKRVEANMASTWAEQERREAEHKEKLRIMDENEKNKKPNPLLNLDIKKIFDTEGAKRRAACFRKMSNSKKAYVSGKQGWYYQGKCK